MKLGVAKAKAARVAFVKRNLQIALPGALAGEPDQIARAVEPGDAGKAAARELERMTALPAAQIENAVVALDPGAADQQFDLLCGVAIVLDHVAVGFEIERVEQGAPPIRRQMAFEVGHRAQSPRADPPSLLGTLRLGAGSAPARAGRIPLVFLLILATPRTSFEHQKRRLPDQGNRRGAASLAKQRRSPDRSRPDGARRTRRSDGRLSTCCRWSRCANRFRMIAESSGSAGANNACRREVRNIRLSFQDGFGKRRTTIAARRAVGVRRAIAGDAPAPPHRVQRRQIHRAGRSSIVPRRAPVARSTTTSWRSPSGNASCRIRRFGAAVIASIRAPRGISIAVVRKGALGACPQAARATTCRR